MASKYDAFWLGRKKVGAALIEEAATNGRSVKLDASAIEDLGMVTSTVDMITLSNQRWRTPTL